ncbi:hypothetical protein M9Y10_046011 [Tritrichomonas musculus]|uniref:BZIP domain-containing protein n=1 Tax=Tritrichomonas musculus TaxID=1915356 RepID=A0ABR2JWW3_9EUKA
MSWELEFDEESNFLSGPFGDGLDQFSMNNGPSSFFSNGSPPQFQGQYPPQNFQQMAQMAQTDPNADMQQPNMAQMNGEDYENYQQQMQYSGFNNFGNPLTMQQFQQPNFFPSQCSPQQIQYLQQQMQLNNPMFSPQMIQQNDNMNPNQISQQNLIEENNKLREFFISLKKKAEQVENTNQKLKGQLDECRNWFKQAMFTGINSGSK